MKELGEYLKQTRLSNGVSITEACEDLEFSTSHLENIESGNVKAFKDVYELKESIRVYAKYLGLNADKVMDEFNNFLFQHTSRISLDDILAAQKKKEELEAEHKKVKSPYTKEYKEKINLWPVVYAIVGVIVLFVIVYIIINSINRTPRRIDELKSVIGDEIVYEYTY
ncbi:MAG: helix-turn-helix domain-containing protein [Bacilli bacterium]|nr:helix-turn-helix domain-containing protein [Bacilli bacterium]